MELENLSRQRIDYEQLPNHRVRAVLTITLPDGQALRYTDEASPADLGFDDDARVVEVGNIFSDAWRAVKKTVSSPAKVVAAVVNPVALVAHGITKTKAGQAALGTVTPKAFVDATKKYDKALDGVLGSNKVKDTIKAAATNKVMNAAASHTAQLAATAKAATKPALLATSKVIGVTSKLIAASALEKHGLKAHAQKLSTSAIADAARLTQSPDAAKSLLGAANQKRKAVESIVRPLTRAQVVTKAHGGALRSNKPGKITHAALLAAQEAGLVFQPGTPSTTLAAKAKGGKRIYWIET